MRSAHIMAQMKSVGKKRGGYMRNSKERGRNGNGRPKEERGVTKLGPYDLNTIVVGDCLEIMAEMLDGWLIRLITFGSLPDVGKALENYGSIAGRDSMSLEERRQACIDVVLREGARPCV